MPSKIKIYNKECLRAMISMPDKSFDIAIVDPPYGIGQVWSKSRKDRFFKSETEYTNKEKPPQKYFDELRRVSKHQIIWGWNYYCHCLPERNSIIVWDKIRTFKHGNMSECELAWTSLSHSARIVRIEWNGFLRGKEKITKKIHPFQKPVGLYRWLLLNFAKPGAKILDTHLGSGSIAIACYEMGFDLTAFEINRNYYRDAIQRIENHKKQLTLI